MSIKDVPETDRARFDICHCGHSRAAHGDLGGACLFRGCKDCQRFKWSHHDEKGIKEFLDK